MSHFDTCERALSTLKTLGAQGLVTHKTSRSVECQVREQKVEKLQDSQAAELSVQIFVDGRYANHTTNDVRPKELDAFLSEAVKLTKLLDADPSRTLPNAKLYAPPGSELPLADDKHETLTSEERKRWAKALEVAARSDARVVSATGSFGDDDERVVMASSNGLHAMQAQTGYWADATVTVSEGDKRPEAGWFWMARKPTGLTDADSIGKKAMARALERIGAKKLKSGEMTLVVENLAAGRLLGGFLQAASGQQLQQKRSFLEGQVGKPVASKWLTLVDDPTLLTGFGARSFDADGMRAQKLSLVEAGVLRNFYLDWYYAQKLGMQPTTGSMSNLVLAPGKDSQAALIANAKKGIFVTAFVGGNSNSLTGDFSLGLQGIAIENGKLTTPVAEMNVTGNHKTFWTKLAAVGNDPWIGNMATPTLVIEGASVSGA